MSKIASTDNLVMNTLYQGELVRVGATKTAEEKIDAFKDHEEYTATIEAVLKEDSSESWPPNDVILD